MRFSDRIGATSPALGLHIEDMPDELRVSAWNLFIELYDERDAGYWAMTARFVAKNFRKFPVDDLPNQPWEIREWMKEYFFGLVWYEAYNFVEFIVRNHDVATRERTYGGTYRSHSVRGEKVESAMNFILERENSGYRFISHVLSPISDKAELEEVEKATELRGKGLEGARQHIRAALDLFSRRPKPDFRNAIKEAISAIESIAKQLGQGKGDGLAPALRALEESAGLHGSLKSAFVKLYGYTSDEKGIRHAMLDESNVGFDEAKYMIVACSAFANYLASKAEKAGLLK